MAKPTSIRLTDHDLTLLDAWTNYLATKRGRPISRSEMVTVLLHRAAEPDELGPEARAVRVAHQKAVMTR